MAGMYPDNQTLEVFGKTVSWPGVNSEGKFTNGDFNDPLVPPSYIPADTINLVVDNLNTLVTSMGGEPNNTEEEQLAALFSSTAVPLSGIKRDAHGRAQVAAPVAADDIARKADIDAGASSLIDFIARRDNPHAVTKGQVGLSNVTNASADSNPTTGTYVIRDAEGRARFKNPASDEDAANKAYVDAVLPAGMIVGSPIANVSGYLPCNGGVYLRSDYPKLDAAMAVIGYPYGAGDGYSTFNVPPFNATGSFLRGRHKDSEGTRKDPQGDAIRNILGSLAVESAWNHWSTWGAFKGTISPATLHMEMGDNSIRGDVSFNASLSVGDKHIALENRPVNHAIYWHIKY